MLRKINLWVTILLIYWGAVSCLYEAPYWTPDGKNMVFGCFYNDEKGEEQYQFFLLNFESGKAQQLTQFTSEKNGICPSLSPDGKKIAFYYHDEQTMQDNQIELRMMNLDGGETIKVAELQREDERFTYTTNPWSPDGKYLAVEELDVNREKSRISLVDLNGQKKNLTEGLSAILPSWSPDGSKLACLALDKAKPDVYDLILIEAKDLSRKVLTSGIALPKKHRKEVLGFMMPAWSPDGNKIAFINGKQISVLDLTTGQSKEITQGKPIKIWPRWSPKGDQLVFMKVKFSKAEPAYGDSSSQICIVASDGLNAKVLTTLRGESYLPQWSPSGDKIAFLFARRSEVSFLLGVVDLQGKAVFYPINGFQKNGLASFYLSLDTDEGSEVRHAEAQKLLEEVVKDYPGTQWAEEALKMLGSVEEKESFELEPSTTVEKSIQK